MVDVNNLVCQTCENVGLGDGSDGFFYCLRCGSQYEDVVDTAVDDDDLFKGGETGGGALYMASHQRQRSVVIKAEPISQYDTQSNFIRSLGLEDKTPQRNGQVKIEVTDTPLLNPSIPEDFGGANSTSYEISYKEIRLRYVLGLQLMIELQCEALVKEFKVTPLICGLVAPIWLRFVSWTGVLDDDWDEKLAKDSEKQEKKVSRGNEECAERSVSDKQAELWFKSLKKSIPLAHTLAVSYLACHVARETVLPSDMMKWTLEGKLPYFSAFVEIEKRMGYPSSACPFSSDVMFRPQRGVSVQKLELSAASIAQSIGLELPPINFYAIAYRYLKKLSLSVKKILPYACRIYEWSMPPDLWLSLSKNYFRLPTHVCVMSILVVAIRILYNINGFGEWEKSLSCNGGASSKRTISSTLKDNGETSTAFVSHGHDCFKDLDEDRVGPQENDLDSAGLLHHLEARYNDIANNHEYSKDLPAYLQYCRDVAFAGSEPSFEETNMVEYLWKIFKNEEDTQPSKPAQERPKSFPDMCESEPIGQPNISSNQMRQMDGGCAGRKTWREKRRKKSFNESLCDDGSLEDELHEGSDIDSSCASLSDCEDNENTSGKTLVDEAIRKMKLDMEENRFCYIPPRENLKRFAYLHYVRKRDEGALTYVAHADYYILLRACARVAQVDIRILHISVLSLERRLAWLENRISECLHCKPQTVSCQFCSDMVPENGADANA